MVSPGSLHPASPSPVQTIELSRSLKHPTAVRLSNRRWRSRRTAAGLKCDKRQLSAWDGASGNSVMVTFDGKVDDPRIDQVLCVAIRNWSGAISFEFFERRSRN